MTADLRNGVAGWSSLGEFPFEKGRPNEGGFVLLRPGTDNSMAVRADAMQFRLAYTGLGDEAGWWRFDGNTIDASGNGNDGTCQGGAVLEPSVRGNSGALSLSGSSAYVQVPDAPELNMGTGNFAISAWFYRLPNAQGNLRILSKGAGDSTKPGYALLASDSGVTAMVGLATTGTSPRLDVTGSYVGTERWHHVILNVNRSGKMTCISTEENRQTKRTCCHTLGGISVLPMPCASEKMSTDCSSGQARWMT